jgi:hypothetical protein
MTNLCDGMGLLARFTPPKEELLQGADLKRIVSWIGNCSHASALNEKYRLWCRKPRYAAVWTRCVDHATSSIRKSWH